MKISIVTISFNQGLYLEDCIKSILDQNYSNLEYIVVDAGSTDQSREIINRYKNSIANVILEPDNGPADGLNKGFALATGEILGFVNADDMLLPGALDRVAAEFKKKPNAEVIYGHGLELDASGKLIQKVWSTPWNIKSHAYGVAVTVQPATFFKNKCFRRSAGFNVHNKTCWDAEFFIDLSNQGASFYSINEFLGAYRMYPGTISSEVNWGARGEKFNEDRNRIFEKIMRRKREYADSWWRMLYYISKQLRQPRVAIAKALHKLGVNTKKEVKLPYTRLVWFGGYPAHYMGDFHKALENMYDDLFFVYVPFGSSGKAFSHEQTKLPRKYILLKQHTAFYDAWMWLARLSPHALIITGNFPRVNLIAYFWAIINNKNIYYLADSNILDRRNQKRSIANKFILKQILYKVTKFLSIGSRNDEFYLSYLGDVALNKLHRFPLPHNQNNFKTKKFFNGDAFVFLVLGRLVKDKSIDRVIVAFSQLSSFERNVSKLIIAGDGPERIPLEALVSELGLTDRVIFLGSIPSDEVAKLYEKSNALVIASQDEPWGLVVNEALSAGLPVIGPYWIGAFADVVVDGVTGFVTEDNSPEKLVVAMRTLLQEPERAFAMGKVGCEKINEGGWTMQGSLKSFAELRRDLD